MFRRRSKQPSDPSDPPPAAAPTTSYAHLLVPDSSHDDEPEPGEPTGEPLPPTMLERWAKDDEMGGWLEIVEAADEPGAPPLAAN